MKPSELRRIVHNELRWCLSGSGYSGKSHIAKVKGNATSLCGAAVDTKYCRTSWDTVCKRCQSIAEKHITNRQQNKQEEQMGAFLKVEDKLDYQAIAKHMESVGWTWHDSKTSPSPSELVHEAYTLVATLKDQNLRKIESGGFVVSRSGNAIKIEFEY